MRFTLSLTLYFQKAHPKSLNYSRLPNATPHSFHASFFVNAVAPAVRCRLIGCNILLNKIPQDARIPVVADGALRPAADVRKAYRRLRPLEKLKAEKRGWTLDVLNVVRSLEAGRAQGRAKATPVHKAFSLAEVYAHEDELARLHPDNRHVRDKIRQQLQVLRDLGLLEFIGPGEYRLM